jgi:hypothetical protein
MIPLRRGRGLFALGCDALDRDAVARLRLNQDPMSDINFPLSGRAVCRRANRSDRLVDGDLDQARPSLM